MPADSLRQALELAGPRADRPGATPEAAAALARFQEIRRELARLVRRGDLTVKVARERAAAAAGETRDQLLRVAGEPGPSARPFLERVVRAEDQRRRARESASIESLQRETNRLLRLNLLERQLDSRRAEFEARAFVRPMTGGQPGPTLDGLLAFHDAADLAGDEAAREWARRQLETFRPRVVDDADRRRIDRACDRPEQVNPRLVAAYVEALNAAGPADLETFAVEAIESRDANACVAAFMLARVDADPAGSDWVRRLLAGLDAFPDAALAALRAMEAEIHDEENRAALALAEEAADGVAADARLLDLEAPTEDQLARRARFDDRPVVGHDEPIGLAVNRRWPSEPIVPDAGLADPE